MRAYSCLVGLVFCISISIFLGFKALISSDILFLRPSFSGEWIVHPNPPIISRGTPVCPKAYFIRTLDLSSLPDRLRLRVTTFGVLKITVNNNIVPLSRLSNWKLGQFVDIVPFLCVGVNEIVFEIDNPKGPPALLIEGSDNVRSDGRWKVSFGQDDNTFLPAVIAGGGESFMADSYLSRNKLVVRCVSAVYFLFLGGLFWRAIANNNYLCVDKQIFKFNGIWISYLTIFIITIIYAHNVINIPALNYGFDWDGHVEYIRFLAKNLSLPEAKDGWEMAQPPLYYIVAAIIFQSFGGEVNNESSLFAIQVVSTLISIFGMVIIWKVLQLLFPERKLLQNFGLWFSVILPAGILMVPTISNEVFSWIISWMTLWLTIKLGFSQETGWRQGIIIGFVCGLALLSKYTPFILFISIVTVFSLRFLQDFKQWKFLMGFTITTFVVSGWFYARNVFLYGNVFFGNWDSAAGFGFNQIPGYRWTDFYFNFGSVLFQVPWRTTFSSLWDGVYASWWGDSLQVYQMHKSLAPLVISAMIYWLALLPTLAMIFGFGLAIRKLVIEEWNHPYLLLVVYTILLLAALILFTLKIPAYSTVKGHFLLAFLPCIAVFAGIGLEWLYICAGKLRWLFIGNIGSLTLLIVYSFWF